MGDDNSPAPAPILDMSKAFIDTVDSITSLGTRSRNLMSTRQFMDSILLIVCEEVGIEQFDVSMLGRARVRRALAKSFHTGVSLFIVLNDINGEKRQFCYQALTDFCKFIGIVNVDDVSEYQ